MEKRRQFMPVHVVPPTRNPHGRETISPSSGAVNGPHQGWGKLVSGLTCFRGRGARGASSPAVSIASSVSDPTPGASPNMPLHLNATTEMNVLLSLAGPIDQRLRPQFLQEVAQELRGQRDKPAARGSCIASAAWFNGNISTRRNCRTRARWRASKGRGLKLENFGRGRDYRSSRRPGFFSQTGQRWFRSPNESIDAGGRDAANNVPATLCSKRPDAKPDP